MSEELNDLPSNPEELSKDPEVIARMLGATTIENPSSQDETPKAEGEENGAATDPDKSTETASEAAKPEGVTEEKQERTVPLAALSAERERNRREREARENAERQAADLSAQLEAARKAQEEGKDVSTQQSAIAEQIAALREEFPAAVPLFESLTAEIQALKVNRDAETSRRAEESQRQAEELAMQEAQALIDANPKLLYWQTEKPELFEAAIEADDRLSGLPQFATMKAEERFAKAVSVVETIYGATEVPDGYLPKKSTQPQQTQEQTRARAEKAVQDAGEFTPRSLSDLPGGMPPPSSELDSIERIPAHQLGSMFLNMSREKQDEYLAKFA